MDQQQLHKLFYSDEMKDIRYKYYKKAYAQGRLDEHLEQNNGYSKHMQTTEDKIEKAFTFLFYNPYAQQTQRQVVTAKNKHLARHKFWEKYPKKKFEIETIYED